MDGLETFMRQLLEVGFDVQSTLSRGFDWAMAASETSIPSVLQRMSNAVYWLDQAARNLHIRADDSRTKG